MRERRDSLCKSESEGNLEYCAWNDLLSLADKRGVILIQSFNGIGCQLARFVSVTLSCC